MYLTACTAQRASRSTALFHSPADVRIVIAMGALQVQPRGAVG